MQKPQVLIVGAGPTGLVLALSLAYQGIHVRIIDKNSKPGEASRAIVIQARTLEFYRQLGFADEAVKRGIRVEEVHFCKGGKEIHKLRFGDFGRDLSPFPFALAFAQDEHEELLMEELNHRGVYVERDTELVNLVELENKVQASLKRGDLVQQCEVDYLCGCDGAHSTVREKLNLSFTGGTYEQLFYVADVMTLHHSNNDKISENGLSVALAKDTFCIILPVRKTGALRLIGIVPTDEIQDGKITFESMQPMLEKLTGLHIQSLNWFSTYHVHHRIAEKFRERRVFLLGDAAHIHSPAGGQGMNTGIGDSVNLAWKLALILKGRAGDLLLDTYETERMAFARTLVATTDRVFRFMVKTSWFGRLWRIWVFPAILSFFLQFHIARRMFFQLISQVRIHYRKSAISVGKVDKLSAGDRLPYVQFEGENERKKNDNFQPLQSLNWQIHIYGRADEHLKNAADQYGLELHLFEWSYSAKKAGFVQNALYLIRPDGYIGFIDKHQNLEILKIYLQKNLFF